MQSTSNKNDSFQVRAWAPVLGLAVVLAAQLPASLHAQIFGQRTLGRPLTSRSDTLMRGAGDSLAGLQIGSLPVQRGAPGPADFIGRDVSGRQTFVGRVEGTTAAALEAADFELARARSQEVLRRRTRNANVLQIQQGGASSGPTYAPRLAVAFEYPPAATARSDRRAEDTIRTMLSLRDLQGVKISIASGVATLQGNVASTDDKKFAEAAANLEPGVLAIDNRLRVRPSVP